MRSAWRHLPPVARPIAEAAETAIGAATRGDDAELTDALSRLTALDQIPVGLVLGTAVRLQLEEQHPDGLTSNDVRAVLRDTVIAHPDTEPQVVLTLLAESLGVQEEGTPPLPADVVARYATLLIADRLAGATPGPLLERTFKEISETQLND